MLEVSCDLELPGNGPQWHQLREGRLPEEFTQYLSPSLKITIASMLVSQPGDRPAARELLQGPIVADVSCAFPRITVSICVGIYHNNWGAITVE